MEEDMDLLEKKQALALRVSESTTAFMRALNDLVEIGEMMAQSGIAFDDADFAGDSIKHLDVGTMTAALTSAEATKDWLATSFNATNFQKARLR